MPSIHYLVHGTGQRRCGMDDSFGQFVEKPKENWMTPQNNTKSNKPFESRFLLLFLLAVLFLPAGLACADGQAKIEIGQPFPDLVLPLLDGQDARLSDFYGKKLLVFNFASW